MDRRSFLKSLAALTGVAVVPDLTFSMPTSAEPIKWVVEYENYDMTLAVAAQWGTGKNMVRYAVSVAAPLKDDEKETIAYCKQALRQWYVERHLRKAA